MAVAAAAAATVAAAVVVLADAKEACEGEEELCDGKGGDIVPEDGTVGVVDGEERVRGQAEGRHHQHRSDKVQVEEGREAAAKKGTEGDL